MDDIKGGDMEWPHHRQGIISSNIWNTEMGILMAEIESVKDERWWICDTDLKYLSLRIDTRDNSFILSIDGYGDGPAKIRIDPQRVMKAISEYRSKYMSKKEERNL